MTSILKQEQQNSLQESLISGTAHLELKTVSACLCRQQEIWHFRGGIPGKQRHNSWFVVAVEETLLLTGTKSFYPPLLPDTWNESRRFFLSLEGRSVWYTMLAYSLSCRLKGRLWSLPCLHWNSLLNHSSQCGSRLNLVQCFSPCAVVEKYILL